MQFNALSIWPLTQTASDKLNTNKWIQAFAVNVVKDTSICISVCKQTYTDKKVKVHTHLPFYYLKRSALGSVLNKVASMGFLVSLS